MRRFLLGFLLAFALVVPAALIAAPPHTVNVVNPMQADLDANFHAITNVGELVVSDAVSANGIFLSGSIAPAQVAILSGHTNPTVVGIIAQPGSVYLERADDGNGALWLKTGPNPTDWTLVSGAP